MAFIDPNQAVTNPTPQPPVAQPANQPPLASVPAPATPVTQSPVSASPPSAPTAPAVPGPQQSRSQPPQQAVSNPPAPGTSTADPNAGHPAVRRAGLLNSVAQALAGGPRYLIDDAGNRVPQQLSGRQIGLAIALEAISGSLSGLAAGKGKGPGAAGLAGLQQGQQQAQQREAQAQQDFANKSKALAARAAIFETNSRTLLNTAEAEKYGSDAIDKMVEINRASGLLDLDDPDVYDNNGLPVSQAELLDAITKGKFSSTDELGPIAGREEVVGADGSKRWVATHLVIRDPNTPVKLTQGDWDKYAAANVPGFPKGVNIGPNGTDIPLRMKQRANEVLATRSLSDLRLNDMRNVLAGTQYADQVPKTIDFSKPGVEAAMTRFQKYVSHSDVHGMDVLESLQALGASKRNPQTGQMEPNSDAKFVDTVASAMGGWPLLEAVHNQLAANAKSTEGFNIIDSESKANAVLASPGKFTQDQATSATNFLERSKQQGEKKAGADAKDRAIAEGRDVEAMYKTGVNPITKERLTLDNAPDSMLVDAKGRPVPQNQQPLYKPSQMERQTGDTARQAIAISAGLRDAVQKNPALVGPLLGRSEKGLAALGLGNAQAQKLLNDVSFLQSAATKVHTGRFSNEILKKMGDMLQPGMNVQQFTGGLDSIDAVMNRYAAEDRLVTVADYREMQAGNVASTQGPQRVIPKGASPGLDANGNIIGYKTADGKVVKF